MKNSWYSLGYILFTALSMTCIEGTAQKYSPILSLFFISVFAALFFHVINLNSIKGIYAACFRHRSHFLLICLNVLAMWVVTFYANAILGSFGFIFITFQVAAIVGFFSLQLQNKKFDIVSSVTSLVLVAVLAMGIYELKIDNVINIAGLWLGIAGGILSFLYRKQSYIFSKKTNLSATQVLAVRFYGILLILGFASRNSFHNIDIHFLLTMIFLSIITFIIPIYLNQKGIFLMGAEKHSIICATCPFVTSLIEAIYRQTWSWKILIMGIISSVSLLFPSFLKEIRLLIKSGFFRKEFI